MSATGGDSEAFEKLQALLGAASARRIDALEGRVETIDAFVGDAKRLEAATAGVLVEAFRAAEVSRHRELATAIAPLVVAAIRAEIVNSKDMMVEALYPITGRLVTAAVANAFKELVESINSRVDALMSADVWRLRLRALISGRSVAEIALAEADEARLKRALLLERGGGRLLASWPDVEQQDDLASGLIAAITEFAATVYADAGGALRNLDLGATKVFLRASAQVIVACEFSGELSSARERRLDEAFLAIVEAHEKDPEGVTAASMGARLAEALAPAQKRPASKTPAMVIGVGLIVALAWLSYKPLLHGWRAHVIHNAYSAAMTERPELTEFPLRLDIDHDRGRVVLRGLSPDERAPQIVAAAISEASKPYQVERDVKIVVLAPQGAGPADGEKFGRDVEALGPRLDATIAQREAASERLRLAAPSMAVFFSEQDKLANPAATAESLDRLAALLKETGAKLRVVGYGDETGTEKGNRFISRKRAEKVTAMLVERGVAPDQLIAVPRATLIQIADQGVAARRSRRVVFELPYEQEFDIK